MKKTDTGIGIGLVALMAVCCGGHLLLLLGLPILAALTGQVVLIAAALVIAVAAIAVVIGRRRVGRRCGEGTSDARTERTLREQPNGLGR
jgi:membrane protein implicated in regulation of membrane protease activity